MTHLSLSDYDYELPDAFIAQEPASPRSHSKLMRVVRATGTITHHHFYDLPDLLRPNDLLVMNNSRVIPARLFGMKEPGKASIELLLTREHENGMWEALIKPGKRVRIGTVIQFPHALHATVHRKGTDDGICIVQFNQEGARFKETLHAIGSTPLPPYITHAPADAADRYQTVYATHDGSVAAPTAGLHFTSALLEQLTARGVKTAYVTLHVGPGTFLPVQHDDVSLHRMHAEQFSLSDKTVQEITDAKKQDRRIVAVGTTTTRVLESVARKDGALHPVHSDTDLFITPGFPFRVVDALITNFHLPRSTLLMLVSAFAGRDLILHAYEEAKRAHYRFFSFGDAMLIE